jgi:hypothetical protein
MSGAGHPHSVQRVRQLRERTPERSREPEPTLATAQVAAQVANAIQVAECTEDVVVTTETGAVAYQLCWGPLVGAED